MWRDGCGASTIRTVPPNKRLKLAAPSCCGGHPFVNVIATRRSLSAIR